MCANDSRKFVYFNEGSAHDVKQFIYKLYHIKVLNCYLYIFYKVRKKKEELLMCVRTILF